MDWLLDVLLIVSFVLVLRFLSVVPSVVPSVVSSFQMPVIQISRRSPPYYPQLRGKVG